jgi:stage III sporulation protein AG
MLKWKKINFLLMAGAAGILLILLANIFPSGDREAGFVTTKDDNTQKTGTDLTVNRPLDIISLENVEAGRLENILSQISGVGSVEVTVNLASTTGRDYAVNTTINNKTSQEKDQRGGNRSTTEISENGQLVLAHESQGSQEAPVVVKEVKPEVKGVVVVAEGAGDAVVRSELMKAVQVYLDIPLYKVIVLPKRGG